MQRRFNTLSLLDYYLGPGKLIAQDIAWNPNDPNVLNMALPGVGTFTLKPFCICIRTCILPDPEVLLRIMTMCFHFVIMPVDFNLSRTLAPIGLSEMRFMSFELSVFVSWKHK